MVSSIKKPNKNKKVKSKKHVKNNAKRKALKRKILPFQAKN